MTSTKLNAADVASIIKACGENNVRSFQMGNLKINFEGEVEKSPTPTIVHYETAPEEKPAPVIVEDLGDLVLTDPDRWVALQVGEESVDENA